MSDPSTMLGAPQVSRRYRQMRRLWRREGLHGLGIRARRALAQRLDPATDVPEVLPADLLGADLSAPFQPQMLPLGPDAPMLVNWVMTPPGRGSGGHTTLFRLIEDLEGRGHVCRVYLYDVYGSDAAYHATVVRDAFPRFRGEIHDMSECVADAHAMFATSWQTAFPVFRARSAGKRFYLVQDFEPAFYPVSSAAILAESTYRMGFHAITAGRWLAAKLAADYGMTADPFGFGCDTDRYRLERSGRPDGVVFYARPEAPRRATELGIYALELFAAVRPDIAIHLYGGTVGRLPFPATQHGHVGVPELNDIYGRCYAGLSLSLTNVSLVPFEMMAAGCLPIVNDAEHNRMVLDNPFVRYCELTPHAIATALAETCSLPGFDGRSRAAAASMQSCSWRDAGAAVERVLRRELTTTDRADDGRVPRPVRAGVPYSTPCVSGVSGTNGFTEDRWNLSVH